MTSRLGQRMHGRCSLRERGVALLEFALVSAVMVPLMLGMMELSIAFLNQVIIDSASREGARAGARYTVTTSGGDNKAKRISDAEAIAERYAEDNVIKLGTTGNPQVSPVTVKPDPETGKFDVIEVTVRFRYVGLLFLVNGIDLESSTVMRYES